MGNEIVCVCGVCNTFAPDGALPVQCECSATGSPSTQTDGENSAS